MLELYEYECECVECGHRWKSIGEKPPYSCPECESNDIEILKKVKISEGKT